MARSLALQRRPPYLLLAALSNAAVFGLRAMRQRRARPVSQLP
ncbi:hypothetical protein HNQ92_005726 [Rhabdobacter roseus]|uniref:Uncharacterized protein n=1 Tax=Rhabdobacter roseus TaxID=1655419 RepID=A0A840U0Z3_9BACT|nr:hypothetical protein [Rhabdobacter roseus]MBB5287562.1 hypothetical protein [Rhabdobacter roseus]